MILVIGDSISAGYGIQRELGWVELLGVRLASHTENFLIVNASVSGETTGGGRGRLPLALDLHNPEIVIIELGANDALRGHPISDIRENLISMAQAASAIGADVIIVGMHIPPNYGPRYTEAFHDVFAEVANMTDASLVPFLLDGISFDGSMMQSDGLHPTASAQTLLLENIWPALMPIIFGN